MRDLPALPPQDMERRLEGRLVQTVFYGQRSTHTRLNFCQWRFAVKGTEVHLGALNLEFNRLMTLPSGVRAVLAMV